MAESPRTGGILVGVDGSDHSRVALDWAIDEVLARGAPLTVVYVFPALRGWNTPISPAYFEEFEAEAKTRLADFLSQVAALEKLPDVTRLVVAGNPAEVLVDMSGHVDLLVVGSRGHGGFRSLVLGSVSTQCVQHARCPVVVVPAGAAAAESAAGGSA